MINYKKVLEKFLIFIKENKIVVLFGLITALSGILIFGNLLSSFDYYVSHRYFISLSTNPGSFFTVIKSFFYNNIIQGSSESITNVFNLSLIYPNGTSGVNIKRANELFNYFMLFISIVVFFIISISSYVIITLNTKKQSIKELFVELKKSFMKSFLLDFIRVLLFTFVFVLIALVSYMFKLNSYFYMILSFTLAIIFFYFAYFVYSFSIRSILFLKYNILESVVFSFKLIKNNFFNVFKNFLLLISIIFVFILILILVTLPFGLLNSYFINIGYNIFNTVNIIFIFIINIATVVFINLFINRFINEVFFDCVDIKKN